MRFVPAEWKNARHMLLDMSEAGKAGDDGNIAVSFAGLAVPFVVGAMPAFYFVPLFAAHAEADVPVGIIGGVLAFGAILVGFVVTLMLFTGKLDSAPFISAERVSAYARRVKYLLSSQANTLVATLLMSLLSICWLVMYAVGCSSLALQICGAAMFGFLSTCICRAFLLPMQIYEIHVATLLDVEDHADKKNNDFYGKRAREKFEDDSVY